MLKQIGWTVILLGAAGSIAVAQTGVTTSGGTTNTVPLFTGSATLGNSNITQSGSNVGIGTMSPGYPLHLASGKALRIEGGTSVSDSTTYFSFGGSGTFGIDAIGIVNGRFVVLDSGSVGIGTTSPMGKFDMNGPGGFVVSDANLDPSGPYSLLPLENSGKLLVGWNRSAGGGEQDLISNRSGGGTGGFNFYDYTNGSVLNPLVTMQGSGNVGIGTTSPSASLEVNGSVKLTSGSGASMTFQDGSVQSVAWNGVLSGGDYAESVNVTGDRKAYEPGDVLVVDPTSEGKFLKSSKPYSTTVTGVYSTKPGAVGRRQVSDRSHMTEEVPMAMVGIIPTKVCAEGGPIQPGDLLVTSSTPGCAMKGTDRTQMLGAVIGKSLGHLESGTAVIEVVVTLQ